MNKAPKIGDRVQLKPGHRYYPCTGTVQKIYKKYRYTWADDDPRWETDETPQIAGVKPERDWHVSMKVDQLPKDWAYVGNDKFAPQVSELCDAP